ncbi:Uncharacterized protein Rs2_10335 [Raphanus sativus]|nr:Uncharacterized protein Rs2_10335 [Raphanus sativus]
MMKALKDVSKSHKKSTSTRKPVAEPSLFISVKTQELIGSLITCEDECDLPSPKSDFVIDDRLTCFEPELPSSLVLSSQNFEEEPFNHPHHGRLSGTRIPLDVDLGPIFDEEDESGPVFDEEAPSINMDSHLCLILAQLVPFYPLTFKSTVRNLI